jgi:hypothetical protein
MMTSTKVDSMMLKINWSQIKCLKDHLARQGYKAESEVLVMALYNKVDPTRTKVKFDKLENYIFDLENDPKLIGLFIFDVKNNKPLWSAKANDNEDLVEPLPTSGHSVIILDYKNMKQEQKDVWLEVMISSVQSYINNNKP